MHARCIYTALGAGVCLDGGAPSRAEWLFTSVRSLIFALARIKGPARFPCHLFRDRERRSGKDTTGEREDGQGTRANQNEKEDGGWARGEIGWNKMEGGILVSCVSSRRIFAAGSLHE